MRTISLQVPDVLADRIEGASDRDKMVWAYRLASLVDDASSSEDLKLTLQQIKEWQNKNGVSAEEFKVVFEELAAED